MKSKKRNANIAFPRHVAVYLCRTMTDESLPKIGIQFGGRDHTTIMNSVERIEEELKENSNLQKIIEEFVDKTIVHKDYFEWKFNFMNVTIKLEINGKSKADCLLKEYN